MTAVIEVARPDHAAALDELLDRCSTETRYQRFFAPVRRYPPAYRAGALAGDPTRHDAVVVPDGRAIVALASIVSGPPGTGPELGVLVDDRHQRQGLGTALVAELVARARSRGVAHLHATVLPGSSRRLRWLARTLPLEEAAFTGDGVTGRFRLL
jgi:GNAT superfamily N-acetyltransferase